MSWTRHARLFAVGAAHLPRLPRRPLRAGAGAPPPGGSPPRRPRRSPRSPRGPSPLWGRDVAAEALVTRADLARARHDAEAERQALLALWSGHPRSPLAAQAERRLGKVRPERGGGGGPGRGAGRAAPEQAGAGRAPPGASEAAAPRSARLPGAAGRGPGAAQGAAALRGRRTCSRPWCACCTDQDLRVRALYLLGTSQAVVAPAAAVKTFDALAREFPENAAGRRRPLRRRGPPRPGRQARRCAVAAGPHRRALPAGGPARRGAVQGLLAPVTAPATRPGALPRSRRWRTTRRGAEESYDVERARYWRARVLDARKRTDEALAVWEALALEHPGTYYGLIARERLAERDPARAARVGAQLAALPPASPPAELESRDAAGRRALHRRGRAAPARLPRRGLLRAPRCPPHRSAAGGPAAPGRGARPHRRRRGPPTAWPASRCAGT